MKSAGSLSSHEVAGILNISYVASVKGQDEVLTSKNKTEVYSANSLLKRRAVT